MINLDAIDKQLLQHLQKDCKQTNKELSNKLNLSVTAVYERIKKLERSGVISNYVSLIDKKKVDKSFVTFCSIKLVQHSKDYVIDFEKEVANLDEVLECYHISGDYDYLLKITTADMKAYNHFLYDKLLKLKAIRSVNTSFSMMQKKMSTHTNPYKDAVSGVRTIRPFAFRP